MGEETRFKIYTFNEFSFKKINSNERNHFVDMIIKYSKDKKWWKDENELKYSLIKCDILYNTYIYGWITQQYLLEQHLYDETKQESNKIVESFEDRFFVVDIEQDILLVDWTRFVFKKPLKENI